MLQLEAVVPELEGQRHGRPRRPWKRIEGRDLRPDVDVPADEPQALRFAAGTIDAAGLLERHAELVRLEPRGDAGMTLRVDIRVHAHRDARRPALRAGD